LELLIPKDSMLEPSFLPLSIILIGENSRILTDTFLPPNYFSINLYSGTMKMEAVCLSEMLERIFTTCYENHLKKRASLDQLVS